ncbi:MAG TPA: ABC transporter ATP-binding protein [Tepidisphaeraceae bacterium]|jgi:ABC-2 type transport system ATP-binding protein
MGGEAVLEADRVWVRFGTFSAVQGVSLSLRGGDLVGLIGPNGAGKTTLLRALAGLQPTTIGVVRVLGEVVKPGVSEARAQIGFTPDTPPMYEELTVRQYLKFIARGYEIPPREAQERIDFWLEKVWLSEKVDVKVKNLSRGMRQRVGIARTLLPNPVVVLLDEPSAGLDPAGRVQFRELLVNLREQGKALIVSSHILLDMAEYCTHIGIMSKGQLVRYGTVHEISQHGDVTRRRYAVTVASIVAGLDITLSAIEGVSDVSVDSTKVTFEYGASVEEAAELLARLVEKKIPVAAFSPDARGLEEAYLRADVAQVD